MRYWKGSWLMGVAAIHIGFSIAAFGNELREVAARRVFNSVGNDPMVGAVAMPPLLTLHSGSPR